MHFFLEQLHLIILIHSASMRVPLRQHSHYWNLLYPCTLYVKPSTKKHFIFRYVQLKIFFCTAFWRLKLSAKVYKNEEFLPKLFQITIRHTCLKIWERTRAWFEAHLNNNSMSPGVEKSFVIWERCCFKAHLYFIRSPVYICPVVIKRPMLNETDETFIEHYSQVIRASSAVG